MDIYGFLKEHDAVSFHMPAHKNRVPFIFNDITEIYGADNLRNPTGIIKNSQKRAAEFLGGDMAYYLVNGASSGLLASAMYLGGGDIAVDRNCHESVILGLVMSGGFPHYIYPKIDKDFDIPVPITKNPYPYPLVYTAVTYYGKAVKGLKNISFCVADEAHGAHFYFSSELKKLRAENADINILSFHKTLPSLTQTAVMLAKKNVDFDLLERCKNAVTSTSPSYPLMASLDYAVANGSNVMENAQTEMICGLKEKIQNKTDFLVYASDDPYKLLLNFKKSKISAAETEKFLRERYNIFIEGIFGDNLLFMLSPYNTEAETELLFEALSKLNNVKSEKTAKEKIPVLQFETVISPREAFFAKSERVSVNSAVGKIAAENITLFPPCVPIVSLGEKITKEAAYYISKERESILIVK